MQQSELLKKAFQLLEEYEHSANGEDLPVWDFLEPETILEKMDLSISKEGASYAELLEYMKTYLKFSVKTGHAQFFNQLYGGNNLPAVLGETLAAFTNTSIYTFEVAPLATMMEIELINKMNRIVGFEDGEGTFVTGGSNANLQALLCARNRAFPDIITKGVFNLPTLTIFVSDHAHYSFEKAANILAIGTENVRKIKTDADGRMIPEALDSAILRSKEKGEHPILIGATTGTTVMGAYDPIEEIAGVAKKHKIWLHCDGSWGGSAILSSKHKHLLSGLELADSFTWNPHKMMNIPLMCSALLVKEKGTLARNIEVGNSDYIFHEHDYKSFDLGKKSMHCGRRVDALKLWMAWKFYGDAGYQARIDKLFELAKYASQKVHEIDQLELMAPVQSLNVCFRHVPDFETDLNRFNIDLRQNLVKSGKSMVNYGILNKQVTIRLIIVNPDLEKADIDTFFDNFLLTANEMLERNAVEEPILRE